MIEATSPLPPPGSLGKIIPAVPLPEVGRKIEDTLPAVILPLTPKLPTFALPVTDNAPPVVKLPPVTLPVAVIKPAVPKLPTFALLVMLAVPEIFAPVPVTVKILELPAILTVTLLLAATLTLLLPFEIAVVATDPNRSLKLNSVVPITIEPMVVR